MRRRAHTRSPLAWLPRIVSEINSDPALHNLAAGRAVADLPSLGARAKFAY